MDDITVNGKPAWMCTGMSALCFINMLAMDAFRGRLSDRIRNRLKNKNNDLMIIPSGMTSQLHPLHVSINKPLKHAVCKHYDPWMKKDSHILTPSGKIKRASASITVEWISKAWKEVLVSVISKSFSKCCVSSAEDRRQDDILWDYSKQSGEGASPSENESATEGSMDELSD
jgi:hypothetical protein